MRFFFNPMHYYDYSSVLTSQSWWRLQQREQADGGGGGEKKPYNWSSGSRRYLVHAEHFYCRNIIVIWENQSGKLICPERIRQLRVNTCTVIYPSLTILLLVFDWKGIFTCSNWLSNSRYTLKQDLQRKRSFNVHLPCEDFCNSLWYFCWPFLTTRWRWCQWVG